MTLRSWAPSLNALSLPDIPAQKDGMKIKTTFNRKYFAQFASPYTAAKTALTGG